MSNTTTVTGNLTREPEIRYTREGHASTVLGVAVNRRWQDRETREWEETTSFFDVVCWRELAENVALTLAKGMRVMVTGRLEQRSWETDEGERRSKVEIVAEEIGPSLRFATAEVQRTQRRAASDGDGEGTHGGDGAVSGPMEQAGSSGASDGSAGTRDRGLAVDA
jgi:single-strand DNA-binding protein